ncbi:hypothetical protein [Fontibacter flavus]|uniref:DUF4251 domain-containing protein n=1 Tax=Fontibacter flavus TaxID=654838 RepID=A0ABV6FX42_9BACT
MQILKVFTLMMAFFMVVNWCYAQSEPVSFDEKKKFVLPGNYQLGFNSLIVPLDLSEKGYDAIDRNSIFPKGEDIDPEIKISDFNIDKVIQYPMPIKKLSGNQTMQIYVPDSTVHYTIRIIDFGERFEGLKK